MKKTLWVWLIAALLMLAAGCGVEETVETTRPLIEVQVPYEEITEPLPYQGVELSVRSLWLREDPCAAVLLQAEALFEKQTGAAVTILWPGESTGEAEKSADILQLSAADFAALPADAALDLTKLAENAGYGEKSYDALCQQIVAQRGCLDAVVQVPYLGGVYYNAEIFAECGITQIPQSWDDFLMLCETLRGALWQPLTLDKEDAVQAMELHLRRTIGNAEITRLMGKDAHWHYDQPAIAALEQVMLFAHAGNVATGTPAEYPAGQNKMALSNAAMMIGTNADCADVEEATLTDLQWGYFPYPGSTGCGSWAVADVLVISRDCPQPQAAFDFLMLLATGELDQLRADISGGIPADPANLSSIAGAVDALKTKQIEPLSQFGSKQTDVAVRLWSGWHTKASSYATRLEWSK